MMSVATTSPVPQITRGKLTHTPVEPTLVKVTAFAKDPQAAGCVSGIRIVMSG
jgi:hypothetical protein